MRQCIGCSHSACVAHGHIVNIPKVLISTSLGMFVVNDVIIKQPRSVRSLPYECASSLCLGQSSVSNRSAFDANITLLSGYLSKRAADNIAIVGPTTFKKRFFWLSHQSLSYADSEREPVHFNALIYTQLMVK